MKLWVERMMPTSDLELFERIKNAVTTLPDIDLGVGADGKQIQLSCHMLARAVGSVFRIEYVDGWFYPNFEHSWVITKRGNIIDLYPVGIIGGPLLLENSSGLAPAKFLYLTSADGASLPEKMFRKKWFRRSVKLVTAALQNAVN